MGLAMSCSELEDMLSERGMLETSIRERDAGNIHWRKEFWEHPSERDAGSMASERGMLGTSMREGNSGNVTSEGWWECDIRERNAGSMTSERGMLGTSIREGNSGNTFTGRDAWNKVSERDPGNII